MYSGMCSTDRHIQGFCVNVGQQTFFLFLAKLWRGEERKEAHEWNLTIKVKITGCYVLAAALRFGRIM